MPHILSIQVGRSQTYGDPAARSPDEKPWTTAFWKEPVAGSVRVTQTNLDGDEQADLRFHGGVDKAVLAYSADHYPDWRAALNLPEMSGGAFGENLTIAGLTEETVCIGDIWRAGEVRFQVSQPRQPCFKLGRRWKLPELVKLVARTGRTGWYLRVLQPGLLQAGDEFTLEERRHAEWPVLRCNRALFDREFPLEEGLQLVALPELADAWKADLEGRLGMRLA